MIKRTLEIRKLKADKKDYYLEMHENIWPELVEEYRNDGIKEISCFLDGLILYVFIESDDSIEPTRIVDPKWQEVMEKCNDPNFPISHATEVFRLYKD